MTVPPQPSPAPEWSTQPPARKAARKSAQAPAHRPGGPKVIFESSQAPRSPMLSVLLTLLAASALAWAATRLGIDTLGHWVVAGGSLLGSLSALYLMVLQPFGHLEVDAANAVVHKVNGTRFKTGKRAIPFDHIEAVEVTDQIVGKALRYAPQLRLKKGEPVLIGGPYAERAAAEKVARRMLCALAGA